MAAGAISAPGTGFGPCRLRCDHKDCAASRKMAATICEYCDGPIAYETRFYDLGDGRLVHAVCHETAIEEDTKAKS